MEALSAIWQNTLDIIKPDIQPVSFSTWIDTIVPVSMDSRTITLEVPYDYNKVMIETRYAALIQNALLYLTGREYEVNIVIQGELSAQKKEAEMEKQQPENLLNPAYTFDTFVIGKSNQLAHAASLAVAEASGSIYNPLFLYGGVGLGKTHLMHAVGNYVLKTSPNKKVVYVSSETFTNDLINAIKDDRTEQFRSKYRLIDILMVDDIQFIGGKEGTQEEFFHTFNTLYQAGKQIILSSDRPPKELYTLEDRLRTRFESGLIVDIKPPDFETRIAILKKKADQVQVEIDDEIYRYVANKITSNIRELEGAIKKIVSYHNLIREDITLSLAEKALKDFNTSNKKPVTPELIIETVEKQFGLKENDLKSTKKTRDIAYPRQMAMYIIKELTDFNLTKIGQVFGGKDHTTVIHAIRKIEQDIKNDPNTRAIIDDIIKNVKQQ